MKEQDSDVDPATAWTDPLDVTSSLLHIDAGLIRSNVPVIYLPATTGQSRTRPIGSLVYADIAAFFPQSCLIYAFASAEVLVELPQCAFVFHEIQGGGYMLNIDEMIQSRRTTRNKTRPFDYASNIFDEAPPAGGIDASQARRLYCMAQSIGMGL